MDQNSTDLLENRQEASALLEQQESMSLDEIQAQNQGSKGLGFSGVVFSERERRSA
jgi:hypothetical protein